MKNALIARMRKTPLLNYSLDDTVNYLLKNTSNEILTAHQVSRYEAEYHKEKKKLSKGQQLNQVEIKKIYVTTNESRYVFANRNRLKAY